jgi:hypothetical protein
MEAKHTEISYTEKEINEAKELYEDYMCTHYEDIMKDGIQIFVNREKDPDGNVISFYIGLEDKDGFAITGYDENYSAK